MRVKDILIQPKALALACCVLAAGFLSPAYSKPNIEKERAKLEYGTILYEFYKKDYFSALVNHAYISDLQNPLAQNENGQLLKAGMMLSYGVPLKSKIIFDELLDETESEITRNAAWYYLAKLFYTKNDLGEAREAIARVKGKIPNNLHIDYHYLATLVNTDGKHLEAGRKALEKIKEDLPEYPYFLFNNAIAQLQAGNLELAKKHLQEVTYYAYLGDEFEVLADRAKHGLSIISGQEGDLLASWNYLKGIRTTGLYSNRALLSYAWAAIKLKQFKEAVPALQILDQRSIAIPEVQEAKVLLAHLYEQDGLSRKALKQNVIAEKEFNKGLKKLDAARELIARQDVPREFITNLETIVRETDWYATHPEVNYNNLTPFLIDLLAANSFQETLKELADLYAIEDNLTYWQMQADQHLLILKESSSKAYDSSTEKYVDASNKLKEELEIKKSEFKLLTLSLEEEDQERFNALFEATNKEIDNLNRTIAQVDKVETPYAPPKHYSADIQTQHKRIERKLIETRSLIVKLEKIMRTLVKLELDKHESRMQYYSAQSRLAKARLYDATLTTLEGAKQRVRKTQDQPSAKEDK